jgi:hypothetical protein
LSEQGGSLLKNDIPTPANEFLSGEGHKLRAPVSKSFCPDVHRDDFFASFLDQAKNEGLPGKAR